MTSCILVVAQASTLPLTPSLHCRDRGEAGSVAASAAIVADRLDQLKEVIDASEAKEAEQAGAEAELLARAVAAAASPQSSYLTPTQIEHTPEVPPVVEIEDKEEEQHEEQEVEVQEEEQHEEQKVEVPASQPRKALTTAKRMLNKNKKFALDWWQKGG